jgi:hypothetical protein
MGFCSNTLGEIPLVKYQSINVSFALRRSTYEELLIINKKLIRSNFSLILVMIF